MPTVFQVESTALLALYLALTVLKAFVFVNALLWRPDAYNAAGKLTKSVWVAILGIALVLQVMPIGGLFGLLSLVGTIAAIVYLVDVRPALQSVMGRR